jgi:hypothetical protein
MIPMSKFMADGEPLPGPADASLYANNCFATGANNSGFTAVQRALADIDNTQVPGDCRKVDFRRTFDAERLQKTLGRREQ